MHRTFKDVIDAWRKDGEPVKAGLERFARDLSIPENTAKQMRRRDSIPSDYWPKVVAGAAKRQLDGITLELLARLRSAKVKRMRRERDKSAARPKLRVPRKEAPELAA